MLRCYFYFAANRRVLFAGVPAWKRSGARVKLGSALFLVVFLISAVLGRAEGLCSPFRAPRGNPRCAHSGTGPGTNWLMWRFWERQSGRHRAGNRGRTQRPGAALSSCAEPAPPRSSASPKCLFSRLLEDFLPASVVLVPGTAPRSPPSGGRRGAGPVPRAFFPLRSPSLRILRTRQRLSWHMEHAGGRFPALRPAAVEQPQHRGQQRRSPACPPLPGCSSSPPRTHLAEGSSAASPGQESWPWG